MEYSFVSNELHKGVKHFKNLKKYVFRHGCPPYLLQLSSSATVSLLSQLRSNTAPSFSL